MVLWYHKKGPKINEDCCFMQEVPLFHALRKSPDHRDGWWSKKTLYGGSRLARWCCFWCPRCRSFRSLEIPQQNKVETRSHDCRCPWPKSHKEKQIITIKNNLAAKWRVIQVKITGRAWSSQQEDKDRLFLINIKTKQRREIMIIVVDKWFYIMC